MSDTPPKKEKKRTKKRPPQSGSVSLWPPVLILTVLLVFFFSRQFDFDTFPPRHLPKSSPADRWPEPPELEPRTLFTPASQTASAPEPIETSAPPPIPETLRTIRVAVWNLYPLTFAKVTDEQIGGRIAEMISEYDLTLVLGFRAKNRSLADALLHRVNQSGERFACVASGMVSPDGEFQAFFYRRDRILLDESRLFDLTDPARRLPSAGFAGAFAAKNVPEERRFTFLLCGARLRPGGSTSERDVLADLYRTLRDYGVESGAAEDDILLGGSFEATAHELGALTRIPNLAAVSDTLITTGDGRAVDHLIFDERAATEYVERFGTHDPAERFKIDRTEANRIAEHFPVYADFSVLENL